MTRPRWQPVMTLAMTGALACLSTVSAEEPPIVTDRPDVTDSSETVARGRVQIEAGINFVTLERDGESLGVASAPTTLVRVGLDRKVELRFEWLGIVSETREVDGSSTAISGSGNTSLGAKIKLREERGAAPRMALLVGAVLPTGSESLRAERIDPAVRLAGSNVLTERLGLAYNLGVVALSLEEDGGDVDTHALGRYSVSLGVGIDDRWNSFVEVFGLAPMGGPDATAHLFDAGLTFRSSNTVQLDLSGGVGLNDAADDWFVGAGFSVRLPR